jgi:hypothetical protein
LQTEALIETGFSFEFVKELYEQFLEFGQNRSVPKSFVKKLLDLSRWINPQCNEYKEVEQIIENAVRSHLELKKHFFWCQVCEKTIPIRGKSLDDAQEYLSQKWVHAECTDDV